jgi:hypothetical protein
VTVSVTDPDLAQTYSFAITKEPTSGTATDPIRTDASTATFTFTPSASSAVTDSLDVTATDAQSPPHCGTVTISIDVQE